MVAFQWEACLAQSTQHLFHSSSPYSSFSSFGHTTYNSISPDFTSLCTWTVYTSGNSLHRLLPLQKKHPHGEHGPGGTVVVAQAFRRCPTWNQHFGSSAKNRQKWSNQKLSLAKPQFHDLCQMFWFLRKTLSGLPEKQQPRFFWLQTQWGEWSLLEAPSQKHVCMYIYIYIITLHYITLYYITLQIMLYYILLYSIKFYCIILYYIALYYIILYYIILYYIMLYYTVLYYIILHYITLYYI